MLNKIILISSIFISISILFASFLHNNKDPNPSQRTSSPITPSPAFDWYSDEDLYQNTELSEKQSNEKQHQRVALKSLETLMLYGDQVTLARRGSPIPQLYCENCKDFGAPEANQAVCKPLKKTKNDIIWDCNLDLPEGYKLESHFLSCEGWDKPGDEYILKGSCGLEYRIKAVSNTKHK
ncbi:hypothetical protein M0813_10382 [Anaeramoeba flamelloides]|uniref:Store-operated calcium entry-associated regulatory factor n=1 Tax=Anaeramoeba flamelloides TaxID=1746091 RepID=A0ABQ8X5A5_9EUKA|nr:hypothetical protein M0813_10382 [Anaeramoeba flamelloides]